MSASLGVDTLNAMIAIALDGATTLAKGADIVRDRRIRALFATLATERDDVVARLQQEVRGLGGVPEDRGTVVGSAHRLYTEVKLALAPNDRRAVIEEIQRSEERVKEKFQELLLRDTALPRALREMVEQQYEQMRRAYDRVSKLDFDGAAPAAMRNGASADPRRARSRRLRVRSKPTQETVIMTTQNRNQGQRNEGEGNKTAAKKYNEAAKTFTQSGRVEAKAEEALKARSSPEKQQLDQAEQAGKRKAKEEDRRLHREPVKSG